MSNPVELIVRFVAAQMGGDAIPKHDSAELARLSVAVQTMLHTGDGPLADLGVRIVGCVIDQIRGGIAAEQALTRLTKNDF